jgi:hypothetical protein
MSALRSRNGRRQLTRSPLLPREWSCLSRGCIAMAEKR